MTNDTIKVIFEDLGGTYAAMATGLDEKRVSYLAKVHGWKRPDAKMKRFNAARIIKNHYLNNSSNKQSSVTTRKPSALQLALGELK